MKKVSIKEETNIRMLRKREFITSSNKIFIVNQQNQECSRTEREYRRDQKETVTDGEASQVSFR